MLPVILQLGRFSITSFGLFLSLGIIFATYFIWRLINLYEIDKEKTLDFIILTFFTGLIGARILYVGINYPEFNNLSKIVFLNLYPGFSLVGGIILGSLLLYYLCKKNKLNTWLVFDIAAVGFFIASSLGSVGCLLGGCQYGVESNSFLAINQVGLIGKRFPVQAFLAIFYFTAFVYLFKLCIKYHFAGKVFATGLILMGLLNFILQFFRGDNRWNQFFFLAFIIFGFIFYYKLGKKSLHKDLKYIASLFLNPKIRRDAILSFSKSCYNARVTLSFYLKNNLKKLTKKLNVKSNPSKF